MTSKGAGGEGLSLVLWVGGESDGHLGALEVAPLMSACGSLLGGTGMGGGRLHGCGATGRTGAVHSPVFAG